MVAWTPPPPRRQYLIRIADLPNTGNVNVDNGLNIFISGVTNFGRITVTNTQASVYNSSNAGDIVFDGGSSNAVLIKNSGTIQVNSGTGVLELLCNSGTVNFQPGTTGTVAAPEGSAVNAGPGVEVRYYPARDGCMLAPPPPVPPPRGTSVPAATPGPPPPSLGGKLIFGGTVAYGYSDGTCSTVSLGYGRRGRRTARNPWRTTPGAAAVRRQADTTRRRAVSAAAANASGMARIAATATLPGDTRRVRKQAGSWQLSCWLSAERICTRSISAKDATSPDRVKESSTTVDGASTIVSPA